MVQIRLDPCDDEFALLVGDAVPKFRFNKIVESESTGYGEKDCQDGDNGKQGTVGQCRGTGHYLVFGKLLDCQK